MLTIIVPVKGDVDIYRLDNIQLFLYDYFQTRYKILIITNKKEFSEINNLKVKYKKLNIDIIDEKNIFKPSKAISGWRYQQILKLEISKLIKTEWYICMDADCFICKKLEYDNLFVNGKCKTNIMTHDFCPATWKKDVDKIIPLTGTYGLGVTPQILNTKICLELLNEFPASFLEKNKFTEYLLYSSFLNKKNKMDLYIDDKYFSKGIWSNETRVLLSKRDTDKIKIILTNIFKNYNFGLVQSLYRNHNQTIEQVEYLSKIIKSLHN